MSLFASRQIRIGLFVVVALVALAIPAAAQMDFHTVTPCRIYDSRGGGGALQMWDGVPANQAAAIYTVQITNVPLSPPCPVPANAVGVFVNVTIMGASKDGYLQVFPAGTMPPSGSSDALVFTNGRTLGKFEIVGLGTGANSGKLSFLATVQPLPPPPGARTYHITLDIQGYYTENVPPTLTAGGTLNYTENDPATIIDNTITVADPNDTQLESATVQITVNYQNGQDVLSFVNTGTITGVFVPATGTLTLTGPDTLANWQTALRNVLYVNTSDGPSTSPRTVTWIADDGVSPSSPVDSTINITAVNDAPSGTDKIIGSNENADYVFSVADFGFSDAVDAPAANALLAVKITTLPTAGSLTLSGGAVSAGQSIAVADITASNLKFTPAANANGTPYASFTFQVQDDGGTANGGVDLDPSANTVTINVTGVNNAPAGTDKTISTPEDTPYTFTTADFGFTDPNDTPADAFQSVVITTLPAAGSLTLSGAPFAAGTEIPVASITAGDLKFIPAANASGPSYAIFTFQVRDNGGTAGGGVDLDASPNTITVDVTAVNDAPAGTNKTVSTPEDTAYTFTTADFGFTDPNDTPANAFQSVVITTLPAVGSLTLSGAPFVAGTEVPVGSITSGDLKFTPAANASGLSYAAFTFQVRDNGGTAGGGVDLDASANTMTIDVTAVNDAPVGANGVVSTPEDTAYTFTTADFGFTDPNDTPANAFQSVVITTLPTAGSLTLSGAPFVAGTEIPVGSITAGNLKFTPAANASGLSYATFTFQVRDNGGTAGGGVDLDASANTMTINVTAVNDAPAGTNKTIVTPEDAQYTFTVADFGFTDPNDTPANTLQSVVIATLPTAGSLTLSGAPFVAGTEIPVGSITAGNLKFTPAANASGLSYADFTFQVRDNGGTAGGGVDLDPSANTITIDVTSVNDAPAGTNNTVVTLEDTQYMFAAADFGFTDPNDNPVNALQSVVIATLPTAGSLTLSGAPFVAGTEIPVGSITAGNLRFTPAPNANGSAYATFTFQVRDNGGTAGGGVDLDPSANLMTIDVTPVNDAPTAFKDHFDYIGNTELRVDKGAAPTPHALETTSSGRGVSDNDSDVEGDPFTISEITVGGCTDNSSPFDCSDPAVGTVHMDPDGKFTFEPAPGDTGAAPSVDCPPGTVDQETFSYKLVDTGAPPTQSLAGTVTLCRFARVWYVDPAGGSGNGTSASPFNSLTGTNLADTSVDGDLTDDLDVPGDYIFIHDGTLTGSIEMEANQHLLGEGVALSFPFGINGNGSTTDLVSAGTKPQLGSGADTVRITQAMPMEIAGLSLSSTAGNALDLTTTAALSGSGTLAIRDNELRSTTAEGMDINLNAGTTGTLVLNITNNSGNLASVPAGNAIDISRVAGTLNLNFSGNTSLVSSTNNAVAIASNALGGVNVTGFSGNSVHGNSQAGIAMSQVVFDANLVTGGFQQVDGDNLAIGDSGNSVLGAGLTLTTVQGNLFFDNLGVYAGGSGLTLSGSGGMTFAVTPNVGIIRASNGAAVDITGATIDLQLDDMDSTTSAAGVSLSSVGGTFSADTDASIIKASGGGTAFSVANSVSGTSVSYGGSLNVTSGSGVSLSSNTGSTIAFSGGMTLSTGANAGFNASGGGTVTVTDPPGAANNTITTTSGTPLTVTGTTIGASGLTFERISAGTSGSPTNGIVLNNTGSGGLTVTGTGSAGSGGTINSATGAGVQLTSAANISLAYMNIQNGGDDGIRGATVSNLNLSNMAITSNGNAIGEWGLDLTELTGSGGIANSAVSGSAENNVVIANTSGTLSAFNVSNSSFTNTNMATGDDGFRVENNGSGAMTISVTNGTFTDNKGDHFQASTSASATGSINVTFTGNTLTTTAGNDPNVVGGGITLSPSGSADMTLTVSSNNIQQAFDEAINLNLGTGSTAAASMIGTVSNNIIGTAGDVDSGSESGTGISVISNGAGLTTVSITGNQVRQYANPYGILVNIKEGSSSMNATITGNTVSNPGSFAINGIRVDAGATAGDSGTLCAAITGNSVAGSGPGVDTDIRLRQRFNTTIRLPGYAGSNSDTTAVNAFIAGNNAGSDVSSAHNVGGGGGGFVGGAACPTP